MNPNAPISSPSYVMGTPDWVKPMIDSASQKWNVPPMVLSALLKQESGFNPNAKSPVGALGIAQFMPGTAAGRGVDPYDPQQSIMGAAQYLSEGLKKYGGDIQKALAAYNAGFGAVDHYQGIPPYKETQNYVKNILAMAGEPHQTAYGPVLDTINEAKKQSQQPLNQAVAGAQGGMQQPQQPPAPQYSQDSWLNDQISQALKQQAPQQQPNQQPQIIEAPRPVQPVGQLPTAPQAPATTANYQIPTPNIGGGTMSSTISGNTPQMPMPNIGGGTNAHQN